MLQKLLRHKLQVATVVFLVLLLAVVRMYEDALFYDPLLDYFKTNFLQLPFPKMDNLFVAGNLFLRYLINTLLSLAMIYTIFKNPELTRFAAVLYTIFFGALIIAFFVLLEFFPESKMILFYVRRFLIQPLFLLVFIPAFYFQERASAKNNVS